MMSTLLMSVRLGTLALLHQFREAVEQIADVVRAGARLRVPLEAERWSVSPRQSLKRPIKERNVSGTEIGRHRRRVDCKTVVLTGDDNLAGIQILHRVVGAVVPELHLQRLRPRREPHQLM